ncbi:MAG: glycosyltransferase family 4 protein [Chloroflexi bacterium]|nr:glycosyltransferase family 4 protein [Chloroflexota bacterium]
MRIAIDASRAAIATRTGTENYSLQIISHMALIDDADDFSLYYNSGSLDSLGLPASFALQPIPFPRLWTHVRLSAALVSQRPDIVFIPAHVLPAVCPARSVVTLHDLGYVHFPKAHTWPSRLYLQASTWFSARYASHVITISEASKRDIMRYCGVPAGKISVIYHGYDQSYRPLEAPRAAPVAGKYAIDSSYFIHVGTLQPRKNIPRLIRAFSAFKDQGWPHQLVLVGKKGWLYDSIAAAVEASPHSGCIRLLGYVDNNDLPALVARASALVIPSLYEGFGLPALEAMACGTPVIASNTSSLPEITADAALPVDPLDEKAICDALCRVASDPDLREKLSSAGLARAARFSWERCARETLEVLKRVAGGRLAD